MPTEGFEEGKLYFQNEDGELKEFAKKLENDGSLEFEFKLKKYSKKRFKKILMSNGIQRNEAEIYSYIAGRTNSRDDYTIICICLGINKRRK